MIYYCVSPCRFADCLSRGVYHPSRTRTLPLTTLWPLVYNAMPPTTRCLRPTITGGASPGAGVHGDHQFFAPRETLRQQHPDVLVRHLRGCGHLRRQRYTPPTTHATTHHACVTPFPWAIVCFEMSTPVCTCVLLYKNGIPFYDPVYIEFMIQTRNWWRL